MTARAQRVAKKKQSEDDGQYKVGDHITAKLSDGRKVHAQADAPGYPFGGGTLTWLVPTFLVTPFTRRFGCYDAYG
jgi:hypothetical protein